MSRSVNRLRLEQLARGNVTVHQAIRLYQGRECTYEEALELAIIELAAQNAKMLEALTQAALRAPPPAILMRKDPS